MAKPLPKQQFDKGRVWAVGIGGAAVLFGCTLLVENTPSLFPAISRANSAMQEATKRMKEEEERAAKQAELLKLRQAEFDAQQRTAKAVEAGLKQAKAKVLAEAPKPAAAAPAPAPAPAAAAAPAPTLAPAPASTSTEAASSSNSTSNGASYKVVEDVSTEVPVTAWPSSSGAAAAGAAAAAAVPAAKAAEDAGPENDAESVARVGRLQGFVADTMASGVSPLEAYKASQRQ
ncbi:hypothetical protein HYH03_011993 [Edaphochlamys debaryana]|uniref:Uncharacterized protein n=1 Tax=Edaphochlamys debaryana TaxID=47281 RepID=A0A835XR07_9CHLO|nr:hypothetical protein HYH03_011993 [Edaphochlamys debaryana]|eukprot:KAG2489542.1 hypothetical protein HYH03_011993 [Edaphochlamys debaryana]